MTTSADDAGKTTEKPESQKQSTAEKSTRGPSPDPEAPGYSALGIQEGDPVEPNEPA